MTLLSLHKGISITLLFSCLSIWSYKRPIEIKVTWLHIRHLKNHKKHVFDFKLHWNISKQKQQKSVKIIRWFPTSLEGLTVRFN